MNQRILMSWVLVLGIGFVPTHGQEPPPGSALKSHRSIRVWLSLGPRKLTLPAVEGQSLRTARVALDQTRLQVARVAEVDDPAAEGTVLVQHPPPGEVSAIEGGCIEFPDCETTHG